MFLYSWILHAVWAGIFDRGVIARYDVRTRPWPCRRDSIKRGATAWEGPYRIVSQVGTFVPTH